VEIQILKV